jgi:hypothetical protein
MKNKKLTYLLVLLVLTIWGFILYRIFNAMTKNPEPVTARTSRAKEAYDDYALSKDTTHLQSGYRDPFGLVQPKDTIIPVTKRTITRNSLTAAMHPGINWADVRYLGYIRTPGSKRLIAIMHINGKEVMMTEGESTEQVKLLKNLRDSIRISYHGQTKCITIKPTL